MKNITVEDFIANNGERFSFNLISQQNKDNEFINFSIEAISENNDIAGKFIISLSSKEKYDQLYKSELDNILFYNNNIDDSGIDINTKGEPVIVSRFDFENLCYDISLDESIYNLKRKEDLENFLIDLKEYIKPEKKVIEERLNKAFITNVYCEDKFQGIGLGKQLYRIAAEWMSENNLTLYTQDIRTEHAKKIWNSIKNDDFFIYKKENNLDCVQINQKNKKKLKI